MYIINKYLCARRCSDGSVMLYHHDGEAEDQDQKEKNFRVAIALLTPEEWASLFVAMSADDDSGVMHQQIRRMHLTGAQQGAINNKQPGGTNE